MIAAGALATRLSQVTAAPVGDGVASRGLGAVPASGARPSRPAAIATFTSRVPGASDRASYLLLAATAGVIPDAEQVTALTRAWRLHGPERAVADALARARQANLLVLATPTILISAGTMIDVHDTAQTTFTTGIQRVVRSTVPVWRGDHDTLLFGWSDGFGAPRTLSAVETQRALGATGPAKRASQRPTIVIPFGGELIVPEIAAE